MNDILLVFTNLPDDASAERLTHLIIEARAAACVSRLAPCASTYRWKDNIETSIEVPLMIKTTRTAYPPLEKLIREAHPYELPAIVAIPVIAGLHSYLDWVSGETDSPKE